jgi:hypothetical protein
MAMTFHRYPPPRTPAQYNLEQAWIEAWVNSGSAPANFVYPYSYLLKKNVDGVHYEAYNAQGLLTYGGPTDVGVADASDAAQVIQPAMDACGAVDGGFYRNALYDCKSLLHGHNNVCHLGETRASFDNMTKGVTLQYSGAAAGVFLDYEDCRYLSMEHIKLFNDGAATVGLKLGGTTNIGGVNTKSFHIRNCLIDYFPTGVLGSSATANHVQPDDYSFYDTFIGHASTCAFDHMGGGHYYGGSLYEFGIGYRSEKVSVGSTDVGMWFFGTTFSHGNTAIDLLGSAGNRTMSFNGCWFERIDTTILNTSNATAGNNCGEVVFDNCIGYTEAGATSFFNLVGGSPIKVEWRSGEIWPQTNPTPIITDGVGGVHQIVSFTGPPDGMARLSWQDSNDGLIGEHAAVLPLYFGGPALLTDDSSAWHSDVIVTDVYVPWRAYTIHKCHFYIAWDPGSAGGEVRLWDTAEVAGSHFAPGAAGYRVDEAVIWFAAGVCYPGEIRVDWKGNDAVAPTVYRAYITYEW